MSNRIRRALSLLALAAIVATAAAAPGDAEIARCFELRDSDPAKAAALAEQTLQTPGLGVEERIKLTTCLGRSAANAGQARRALDAVAAVDALMQRHPMPPEFQLRALSNSGATLHMLGNIQGALDYYGRAYEAAKQSESDEAQAAMLANVGSIQSEGLGAFEEAEAYFARAAEVERRIGEPRALLPYNRGMNFRRMGRPADALAAFAEAERLASAAGQEMVLHRARAERLALPAADGRLPASARGELLEIVDRQQALADPSGAATTLLRLSQAALRDGQAQEALARARQARGLLPAEVFGFEQREALLAELAALRALGDWRQALAASEELRAIEVAARQQSLEGLAGLQARLQDTRSAEELLRLREERRIEALELAHAARLRNASIAAFLTLVLLVAAFAWYQRGVTARLRRLSTVDGLTGLLNRRAASRELQRGESAAEDADRRSVVFLIDIDHFKGRNDRHGHAAGDAVLKAVALQLRASSRPGDLVARWGGEEFLVGCRNLDLADASAVAERLRTAMASLRLDPAAGGADEPLSVSIGFASQPFFPGVGEGWEDTVSLADRALYAAKRSGRDAWVGLWGRGPGRYAIDEVLADPAALAARGEIEVASSRQPVPWQAPAAGG
ncbi:diguanylate cyclase domain-containing protein [Luteimonas sp. SDU82]|uniref:GGDEF domain-containing protein n=1 Tax=Luteimonas sp. SDU82 TaxID=3422592 RepID=UPI003EBD0EEB